MVNAGLFLIMVVLFAGAIECLEKWIVFSKNRVKTEIKRIRKNRKDSDGFSLYTVFAFFIIRKEEFLNYF